MPRNILETKLVLVQEGMTDPETLTFHLVKVLKLPRWIAQTAATGLSDLYDIFCVASDGYRDLFIRKGVRPDKMRVTGGQGTSDCPLIDPAIIETVDEFRVYIIAVLAPQKAERR
ncbi:MAG: hypothetical protein ACHBNF_22705 [Chromatiales bacterium]